MPRCSMRRSRPAGRYTAQYTHVATAQQLIGHQQMGGRRRHAFVPHRTHGP